MSEREAILRAAVAAMPHTNPGVADDLIEGFTMHTEAEDIIAIWQAARALAAPTAPTEPVRPKHFVFILTEAYEAGVGKGHQAHARGTEIANPWADEPCREAWGYGYDEGKKQAARAAPPSAAQPVARPIEECYGDCPTDPKTCANPCNFKGRGEPVKPSNAWVYPKDSYAMPVLFNPYTGEPRDARDVQSDPRGVLIAPPGNALPLAAAPTTEATSSSDAERAIAGALFDFLGFLTTSERQWTFSSYDEASPAVEALEQWAKKRNLSLDEADVSGWSAAIGTKERQR